MTLTRRAFIAAGSVAAVGAALASPVTAFAKPGGNFKDNHTIYRFSVRGRRASRAAKVFCANFRFKTKEAAKTYPLPHPGINARIVGVVVSGDEFRRLFISRHSFVADLRLFRKIA